MGRGAGRDSWAHAWFDSTERCRHVNGDGVRCEVVKSFRSANARALHVKTHGLDAQSQ